MLQRPMEENINTLYAKVEQIIQEAGFNIFETDISRPWGGFVRLENSDAEAFIAKYFPGMVFETYENLSPKFLIVAPGKRLSWQKHDRRAELWRVLEGPVGVKLSDTDEEPEEVRRLEDGEVIQFDVNVRHRLIGLEGWGIVTEIWQHADGGNLSDESDIIRISDDFGR